MSLAYAARDICKYYGNHLALRRVSFQLFKGESLVLTGPNGSGKSTLLRLLAFLEPPSSGELQFFGNQGFPRRQITLLLQEPYLFRESVFHNVTLGLRIRGICKDLNGAYSSAMAAAGFLDPRAFARRRPYQLSGGERQRVALASRLILDPLVLLLDEPTSYVDSSSARTIVAALSAYRSSGGTLVCATHDISLMASLSARELNVAGTES